jgi:hypothetical protein
MPTYILIACTICEISQIYNTRMHFILNFKVKYLNAWGWWVWLKHVVYIDKLIKFVVVDGSTYVNFNLKQDVRVSSYTQILHDPTFLEPYDCNKATTDSDTLSMFFRNFLQLKSWLCVGTLWETIFCVSYMQIHILMCLMIVKLKFWTVTVTSQLVHINNCNLAP